MTTWALVTGEYPSQRGGVADYTQTLARCLVADGNAVIVVAPPLAPGKHDDAEAGITLHRLPDVYSVGGINPRLAGRVSATDDMASQPLADHLAICDLLVRPYEDGMTTRRISATVGLDLGVPMMTTKGKTTESFWQESGAAELADCGDTDSFVSAVDRLASDLQSRHVMSERTIDLYGRSFRTELTARDSMAAWRSHS